MSEPTNTGAQALLRLLGAVALGLLLAISAYAENALSSKSTSVATGEVSCGDSLAQLNKKLPALKFVVCEKVVQYGTPALVAEYRVEGINAGAVENHLVKSARMPRLRFLCCGWESVPASSNSKAATGFYVQRRQRFEATMTSGESIVNQRKRWAEILYFQVKVTTYTESP